MSNSQNKKDFIKSVQNDIQNKGYASNIRFRNQNLKATQIRQPISQQPRRNQGQVNSWVIFNMVQQFQQVYQNDFRFKFQNEKKKQFQQYTTGNLLSTSRSVPSLIGPISNNNAVEMDDAWFQMKDLVTKNENVKTIHFKKLKNDFQEKVEFRRNAMLVKQPGFHKKLMQLTQSQRTFATRKSEIEKHRLECQISARLKIEIL